MEEIGAARAIVALVLLGVAAAATARAEGEPREASPTEAIDEVARTLAEMITPRWEGPRVPWPDPEPRPPAATHRASRFRPLAVHAGAEAPEARVDAALAALEVAYDGLGARGYAPPYPDGGRGGGERFDLYLVPEGAGARGASDERVAYGGLDGVTSFARVDPRVPAERLEACVAEAYADAVLLALDPAESSAVRRATAAYLAHEVTGRFGCGEGAGDAQRAPERAPLVGAAEGGEGGAILLWLLAERHDGGTGAFVHALWEVVRQKTWDRGDLRARPDFEGALAATLERAGGDLRATMVDFAVARFFLGTPASSFPRFTDLGLVPPIEPEWRLDHAALPAHLPPSAESVARFGSSYAEVDVRGAPAGSRLRVWLRGEQGVDWSLVAVPLDAAGRERGRVTAPPGPDPRRSYLAVELAPEIARVVVVVTNLGATTASGDRALEARRFQLIVDAAPEGGGGGSAFP